MDTYSLLRQIADSWVLLAMFGFFLAVVLWAFRPGSTAVHDQVSNIPLRNDTAIPEDKTSSGKSEKSSSSADNDFLEGGR